MNPYSRPRSGAISVCVRDEWTVYGISLCEGHSYLGRVCMYVYIYRICIALISCSMHVHKRFNNIVSKNCEEKGASLVGS